MDSISKEYQDFMKWFQENYPQEYEKYKTNIHVPFQLGEGVRVSNDNAIFDEEYDLLYSITQKYYKGDD